MRLTTNTLDVARLPVVLTVSQYAAILQMKPDMGMAQTTSSGASIAQTKELLKEKRIYV